MRYLTLRFGKRQRIAAAAVALTAVLFFGVRVASPTIVFDSRTVSVSAKVTEFDGKDMAERTEFLARQGFSAHGEVTDTVRIPDPFDTVYERYNELQLTQGFDLYRYRGKEVQRFRYPVTSDFGDGVATLLVYHEKIIGGDFSSGGERYALCAADPDG